MPSGTSLASDSDQPVYRLLGGTTKERIPAYNTGGPETIERGLELGISISKSLSGTVCLKGKKENGERSRCSRMPKEQVGPDISIMIECIARWNDVDYTIDMARRLEHLNLYWIEEPLSPDNILGYERLVREIDSTRIASGEHEYTRYGLADMILKKAADLLQPDVIWSVGVTSLRRTHGSRP